MNRLILFMLMSPWQL